VKAKHGVGNYRTGDCASYLRATINLAASTVLTRPSARSTKCYNWIEPRLETEFEPRDQGNGALLAVFRAKLQTNVIRRQPRRRNLNRLQP